MSHSATLSDNYNPPDGEQLHLFSNALSSIICVLNTGRHGGLGTAAVHASKQGYRITLDGHTFVKGKTPSELHKNFKAAVTKAINKS